MNIKLVDVDGKIPNFALMKISSFHKKQGDKVDWHEPMFDKNIDKVYASKIFNFTDDYNYYPDECEVVKGGTGYEISKRLPEEIESVKELDYSLYPDCDYSIQFYHRGCVNNCSFCVVREKEGYMHPVDPVELNPNGKWIRVMDNNFFENPEWKFAVKHLKSCNQPVSFESIDIRTITDEQLKILNTFKLHKQIHIAWDNVKQAVDKKIENAIKYVKAYKFLVYVLIGYNSTPEEDLYRVERLRELKVDPFVMPYNKKDEYQRRFARWCNHKAIFRKVKWSEYNK
jgi:radical SAM superfamily enzyme YgiQ (UPF0313 family)